MDILNCFYEKLHSTTEKRGKLSVKRLEKCYNSFKETIEIGEIYVENYEKLYKNPSTNLIFKKINKHPFFPFNIYVCVGVEKNNEVKKISMTEILICQNNKWFFDVNSCDGSSSEISEDFYSLKL